MKAVRVSKWSKAWSTWKRARVSRGVVKARPLFFAPLKGWNTF